MWRSIELRDKTVVPPMRSKSAAGACGARNGEGGLGTGEAAAAARVARACFFSPRRDASLAPLSRAPATVGTKLYVHGGLSAGNMSDMYAFDLITHTWKQLRHATGGRPEARSGHTMTSDEARSAMAGGVRWPGWAGASWQKA